MLVNMVNDIKKLSLKYEYGSNLSLPFFRREKIAHDSHLSIGFLSLFNILVGDSWRDSFVNIPRSDVM